MLELILTEAITDTITYVYQAQFTSNKHIYNAKIGFQINLSILTIWTCMDCLHQDCAGPSLQKCSIH